MLRETTFRLGGSILIVVGVWLAFELALAQAGWSYFGVWFAAGGLVGFGAFFVYVARDAAKYRRDYLAALESGRPPPPGGPPR